MSPTSTIFVGLISASASAMQVGHAAPKTSMRGASTRAMITPSEADVTSIGLIPTTSILAYKGLISADEGSAVATGALFNFLGFVTVIAAGVCSLGANKEQEGSLPLAPNDDIYRMTLAGGLPYAPPLSAETEMFKATVVSWYDSGVRL